MNPPIAPSRWLELPSCQTKGLIRDVEHDR